MPDDIILEVRLVRKSKVKRQTPDQGYTTLQLIPGSPWVAFEDHCTPHPHSQRVPNMVRLLGMVRWRVLFAPHSVTKVVQCAGVVRQTQHPFFSTPTHWLAAQRDEALEAQSAVWPCIVPKLVRLLGVARAKPVFHHTTQNVPELAQATGVEVHLSPPLHPPATPSPQHPYNVCKLGLALLALSFKPVFQCVSKLELEPHFKNDYA